MEHGRYPYLPSINRQPLEWPNGARLAFYVGVNIEHFLFRGAAETPKPDVMYYTAREYGSRVGVFRIMDVLDKHGIRASVLLNSDVCLHEPQIIEEGNKRGWEWLGHGITNSIRLSEYPEAEEREVIRRVKETITKSTGTEPKGWLGPALAETYSTPDHLAAEGFEYICDWGGDDQPVPMRVASGRMIAIPYMQGLNDMRLIEAQQYTGPQYLEALRDQFDVLHAESATSGRVLALPIHPFVVGLPYRAKYLDEALGYICSHKDVWVTTSGEIAAWYYQRYYRKPE